MEELQKLETEYQAALLDVGLGYAKVEEELQSLKQKDQDFIHQREVAEVRGEHALKGKALKNYLELVTLRVKMLNLLQSM